MKAEASNPQQMRAVALVFVIVGMVMLATAGFLTFSTLRFLDRSVHVQGTITALVPITHSNDNQNSGNAQTTYAPQFSFTTTGGEAVTVTSHNSSNPAAFDVGESVSVLYDPGDAEQARIDSFWQLWAASIILGGIGTVFLGIVFAVALSLRARSRGLLPSSSPH
jgi:hypothetical protein